MPKIDAMTLRSKIIGVLIQGARLKGGRTLEECAQVVGVQPDVIAAYENGLEAISLPELELLAYFLNVPIVHFWENGEAVLEPDAIPPSERHVALRQRILAVLLRSARLEANKSLDNLALLLGIPLETLEQYERGEQAVPLVHLELLSDHFGVPMTYFLDEGVGRVGERELNDRLYEQFLSLPEDIRKFVIRPINVSYLRVAMRLAEMSGPELRGIAEGILEITY